MCLVILCKERQMSYVSISNPGSCDRILHIDLPFLLFYQFTGLPSPFAVIFCSTHLSCSYLVLICNTLTSWHAICAEEPRDADTPAISQRVQASEANPQCKCRASTLNRHPCTLSLAACLCLLLITQSTARRRIKQRLDGLSSHTTSSQARIRQKSCTCPHEFVEENGLW